MLDATTAAFATDLNGSNDQNESLLTVPPPHKGGGDRERSGHFAHPV